MTNIGKSQKIKNLKNIVLEGGSESIEDVEPTIFMVIEEVFGLVNQYKQKASDIKQGGSVGIGFMYGKNTRDELHSYKFEQYIKLINQMEIYLKMNEGTTSDGIKTPILKTETPKVAISYCWQDNELANSIDRDLQKKNIEVIRDIRNVENWTSLTDFMKSLKNQKFVILLISDSYLKSSNCMFEVLEIMKTDYQSKVLPLIIDNAIYSTENQVKYINYWEEKSKDLKSQIDLLEYINS